MSLDQNVRLMVSPFPKIKVCFWATPKLCQANRHRYLTSFQPLGPFSPHHSVGFFFACSASRRVLRLTPSFLCLYTRLLLLLLLFLLLKHGFLAPYGNRKTKLTGTREGNAKEKRKEKTHTNTTNTPGPERAKPEGQEKRQAEADENGPRAAERGEDGIAKTNLPKRNLSLPGNAQDPNLPREGSNCLVYRISDFGCMLHACARCGYVPLFSFGFL